MRWLSMLAMAGLAGIPARGVTGRRYQAEDARDARSRANCARTFWASRQNRTPNAARAHLRFPVQGPHRHQDRHPAAEIRRRRVSYVAALNFSLPAGPKQNGEMLSTSFSSPASANRAYFVARNLTFAQDQQPSKADMIKEVMDKYGVPTIVGDQHLYYIYRRLDHVGRRQVQGSDRAGSDRQAARSAGPPSSSTATPSAAVAWRWSSARRPRPRTPSAMLTDAKGANCDGVLSVQLAPGTPADRVGIAQFTLLDVKRVISAAAIDSARRWPPSERAQCDAERQRAEALARSQALRLRRQPRPRATAASSPCRWRCAAAARS